MLLQKINEIQTCSQCNHIIKLFSNSNISPNQIIEEKPFIEILNQVVSNPLSLKEIKTIPEQNIMILPDSSKLLNESKNINTGLDEKIEKKKRTNLNLLELEKNKKFNLKTLPIDMPNIFIIDSNPQESNRLNKFRIRKPNLYTPQISKKIEEVEKKIKDPQKTAKYDRYVRNKLLDLTFTFKNNDYQNQSPFLRSFDNTVELDTSFHNIITKLSGEKKIDMNGTQIDKTNVNSIKNPINLVENLIDKKDSLQGNAIIKVEKGKQNKVEKDRQEKDKQEKGEKDKQEKSEKDEQEKGKQEKGEKDKQEKSEKFNQPKRKKFNASFIDFLNEASDQYVKTTPVTVNYQHQSKLKNPEPKDNVITSNDRNEFINPLLSKIPEEFNSDKIEKSDSERPRGLNNHMKHPSKSSNNRERNILNHDNENFKDLNHPSFKKQSYFEGSSQFMEKSLLENSDKNIPKNKLPNIKNISTNYDNKPNPIFNFYQDKDKIDKMLNFQVVIFLIKCL